MTSGRRRKLLSTDDLDRGAREVVDLVRPGDKIAAAGGYAMQIYGSDRLTADLDVVADGPVPGLRKLEPLSFGGYSSVTPSGVPLDVILRSDAFEGLYEAAIKTSQRIRSVPIRVVRPEYLAAMKMVAGRPKDEIDLLFLLEHMDAAARQKASRVALRFLGAYGAKDLEAYMKEADWVKARR